MAMATPERNFVEARREIEGMTARAEKRALRWLAPRVPGRITSDHLTLLGLAAMAACAALYAASAGHPRLLLLVDVALAVNWLGDSLDGTLARHRGCPRPRFGFYVDHLADAFGALFLLAGLAASGLMSPLVAAATLAAYFLLAIETYLATYALGNFKISWGPVGGTELRMMLAALNAFVMVQPRATVAGRSWLLFDLVGLCATVGLVTLAALAGERGVLALARVEGWAPALGTRDRPRGVGTR
jgi:archaetidylinositol phosphate synthase